MTRVEWVTISCDVCGSADHRLLFVKEGFRHVRCETCGMVFVNPRLAGHLDFQASSGTGSMGDDSLSPPQRQRLRKELSSMEPFRRLNRIMEVGAGRGWFLLEASRAGWETWAVEINSSALDYLRKIPVNNLVVEPAEEFHAPAASVDVVRMWDVIEHLESPRRAVAHIHRVLRPGGLLRLATTNFASLSRKVNGPEWVYLNGSDHIFLFEPDTIRKLLADAGFWDVKIRTRSFNLRRKLYHPEHEPALRWSLWRPFRKLIDETIRLTSFGHQMIVTAVKPE
ncbi:MAG: class I SAM-dependent methyltransferase [Desulfomonile tiedjei]|nr:class I SAM-dependent methyltransferase [Desulfomonile tiedjei]